MIASDLFWTKFVQIIVYCKIFKNSLDLDKKSNGRTAHPRGGEYKDIIHWMKDLFDHSLEQKMKHEAPLAARMG